MRLTPQRPFAHFVGDLAAIRQLGTRQCSVVLLNGSPVLRAQEPVRRNKNMVVPLSLKNDGIDWAADSSNDVLEDAVSLPELDAPDSAEVHIVITARCVDVFVGE